ncbi:MAG: alkaline phosphatase family protein [Anaerolineae bacterium]
MSEKRVLVIGLDGGTLDVIRPWAEAGELPTFQRLLNEGTAGPLKSTIPTSSPAAWTSFMTGVNPGKHGTFDFLRRRPDGYDLQPVRNYLPGLGTMFAWASRHGRRVAVVNVPLTYPPEPVNGIMVAGLGAPDEADYTYPAGLSDTLRAMGYRVNSEAHYEPGLEDAFLREITTTTDKQAEVGLWLFKKEPWDFFTIVLRDLDAVFHSMWSLMDATHPAHDPERAALYGDAILNYHKLLDARIADFLDAVDDNTVVMIMSDHGSGPYYREVYLNVWLQQEGFQTLKQGARDAAGGVRALLRRGGVTRENLTARLGWHNVNRIKERLPDRVKALVPRSRPEAMDLVDWSQTRAYSFGLIGQIYINLRGREPQGIVEPGAEYEHVVADLVERLGELTDPETGKQVVDAVYRREELYHGPHAHQAPDLCLVMRDLSYTTHLGTEFTRETVFGPPINHESGNHRPYGMLMAWGPGIRRRGSVSVAEIIDLAPTILHLLGVPVPEDMDGRVLTELLDEPAGPPADRVAREQVAKADNAAPLTAGEEAELMERLRNLGYLA